MKHTRGRASVGSGALKADRRWLVTSTGHRVILDRSQAADELLLSGRRWYLTLRRNRPLPARAPR